MLSINFIFKIKTCLFNMKIIICIRMLKNYPYIFMAQKLIIEILKPYFTCEQILYIKELIEYNISGGKNIRSKLFLNTLNRLTPINHPNIAQCIEILQGSFCLIDDSMDNSTKRRNKDCWYIIHGIGVIRDGLLLINIINVILRESLSKNIYQKTINCFHEIILKTCLGQTQDILRNHCSSWDDLKKKINMINYEQICYGKSGYYTFYLPLKLAFICSEKGEPKNLRKASEVLGLLYQLQDDYLNFYPELSGKDESDIKERKLTWILCKIIEEGYDGEVLDYYNGGNEEIIRVKSQRYLSNFDQIEDEALKKIKEISDDCEMNAIINECMNILYKRKK